MREINAINTKKHFVVTTGTNVFHDWIEKSRTKQSLQVCEAISLLTMCIKFCINIGKL